MHTRIVIIIIIIIIIIINTTAAVQLQPAMSDMLTSHWPHIPLPPANTPCAA
jgi:uncharacterized integral membrane protein